MGRFQVRRYGRPVPDSAFGGRQARRLLAILAVRRGQVVTREVLIESLWPRSKPSRPAASLNAIVGRLRKALGEPDLVHTVPNGYLLADDDRCVVDIEPFERDVLHGLELLRSNHHQEAAVVLEGALTSWEEPLPEETYSDWAADPIRRLQGLCLDALEAATRAASAIGDHKAALRYGREATSRDELGESAAVTLARAQAVAGDSAGALGTLDRHRRLLASELGLEPSPEAAAARDAILRRESPLHEDIPGSGGLIHPATPLVGREQELHELEDRLERARLVTLTGPGGVGKTRLAIEAAGRRGSGTAVVVCSLDHLEDPDVVPHLVAHAADVIDAPDTTTAARIAAALRDRETLLLLDGCEAVIDAVRSLVATLLARCPALTLLVTSRERCHLPGEHVVHLASLDHRGDAPAVRLFLERAVEADPSFQADQQTIGMVEEICRRLDGIPLALELAATRISSMSIRDLLQRLEPLPLGETEPLFAAVESSYRLLAEGDRRVLERLTVFPSDFDLAAAEEVAAPSGPPTAIARLVDKSLVSRVGTSRYRLLETTRVYGARRLEERGETHSGHANHTRYYLDLAEAAADGLVTSDEARWVDMVGTEMDNLRSVHRRAVARCSHQDALSLAASMAHYAQWRLAPEPFEWAAEATALEGAADHPLYIAAVGTVALGATNRGELEQASSLARRALARADGSAAVRLTSMRALCLVALYEGRSEECHRLGAELEEMAKETDQPFFSVDSRLIRAAVDVFTSRSDAASYVGHALREAERLGNPSLIALGNELMGESLQASRPEQALEAFQRADEIAEEVSCRLVRGLALLGASRTLVELGRVQEGAETCRRAILHWRRAGSVTHQWITLRNAAELLARAERGETARRIMAATDADDRAPETYGAQAERLAALREHLGSTEQLPPTLDEIVEETVTALGAIDPTRHQRKQLNA